MENSKISRFTSYKCRPQISFYTYYTNTRTCYAAYQLKLHHCPGFQNYFIFFIFIVFNYFPFSHHSRKKKRTHQSYTLKRLQEQDDLLVHFIVMEPPPGLLWRSSVFTLLYIAIIIIWSLLQSKRKMIKTSNAFIQHRNDSRKSAADKQTIRSPICEIIWFRFILRRHFFKIPTLCGQ